MPKQPYKHAAYEDSVLGQSLTETLANIMAIKNKYEAQPIDAQAKHYVDLLIRVLETFHSDIFPKFTHGKTPSLGIWDLWTVKQLNDLLGSTGEYALYERIRDKVLPKIVPEATAQHEKRVSTYLVEQLEAHKGQLFSEKTSAIPLSGNLDTIFTIFINAIKATEKEKETNIEATEKKEERGLEKFHHQSTKDNITEVSRLIRACFWVYRHQANILTPPHPMAYEVLEEFIQFINKINLDLNELAPFFNPQSVVNVYNGVISNPLIMFFFSKVARDYVEQYSLQSRNTANDGEPPDYKYEWLDKKLDLSDAGHTNASEALLYTLNIILYRILIPARQKYLVLHGKAHLAQFPALAGNIITAGQQYHEQDNRRAKFLRDLRNSELSWMDSVYSRFQMIYDILLTQDPNPLREATKKLQRLEEFTETYLSVTPLLTNIPARYKTKNVSALLQEPHNADVPHYGLASDDNIFKQYLPDDISWISTPEEAQGDSVWLIRKALHDKANAKIKQAKECYDKIMETQKDNLEELPSKISQLWRQRCDDYLKQLYRYQETILSFKSFPLSSDLPSLKQTLKGLTSRKIALETMQSEVAMLLETAFDDILLAKDHGFRRTLEADYMQVRLKAEQICETLSDQLLSTKFSIDKDTQTLNNLQKQADAEAQFTENMQATEPALLQQLLDKGAATLAALQEQFSKQIQKHQETVQTAAEKSTELQRLNMQNARQSSELQQLDIKRNQLHDEIASRQQSSSEIPNTTVLDHQKALLMLISSKLKENKDAPTIPFKQIEEALANTFKDKKVDELIKEYLELVNSAVTLQKWRRWSNNEQSSKKRKERHERLFNNLETTLENISTTLIRIKAENHTISQNKLTLDKCIAQHAACIKNLADLRLSLATMDAKRFELMHTITSALEHLHEEQIALERASQQVNQLKNDQYVLKNILLILTELTELKEHIELLTKNQDCSDLMIEISSVQAMLDKLNKGIIEIEEHVSALHNPMTFKTNLSAINALQKGLKTRLEMVIGEKLLEHITTLNQLIEKDHLDVKTLSEHAKTATEPMSFEVLYQAVLHRAPLHASRMVELQKNLALIPLASTINLPPFLSPITEVALNEIHEQHDHKLQERRTILEEEPEIQPRDLEKPLRKLVLDAISQLTTYSENRAKRFETKDAWFRKDKDNRHVCIASLKLALKEYETSGDPTHVLSVLRTTIPRFPGTYFQPLLYKIMVNVLDQAEKDTTTVIIEDHSIKNILATLKITHEDYATAMESLYHKIAQMKLYGEELNEQDDPTGAVVIRLADQLKQDTDFFLIAHQNAIPDQIAHDKFKEKFCARLHSEDDTMSQHSSRSWLPIVANLLLAIFLIPQLLQSKYRNGRYEFFFTDTTKLKQLRAIENTMEQAGVTLGG